MVSQEQAQVGSKTQEDVTKQDIKEIVDQLKEKIPENNVVSDVTNVKENNTDIIERNSEHITPDYAIHNANELFLIKTLSPEITHNEEKRRKHKDTLIGIMKWFLTFQFLVLTLLLVGFITTVLVFHGLNNDFSLDYMNAIIKFICIYITSVVVELIAMLKYIVENVFDTSITGLVGMYRNVTENKEKLDISNSN